MTRANGSARFQLGGNERARQALGAVGRSPHSNSTPILAQGKAVGAVRGGVFYKRCRASVHMLRKPPAWALDVQSLLDAEAAGAREVEILDVETNRRWRASVALLRSDKAFELNRGFGLQVALPLRLWQVEDAATRQLRLL